jgi:hypothetical protein
VCEATSTLATLTAFVQEHYPDAPPGPTEAMHVAEMNRIAAEQLEHAADLLEDEGAFEHAETDRATAAFLRASIANFLRLEGPEQHN